MTPDASAGRTAQLDPFTVFSLPRRLDLDDRALEQRWLQLSRECHPDRHRSQGTGDCAAVLARAAEINDSWRALRDRWERARVLLDLEAPGALAAQNQLDPEFLAQALELAEAVAMASAAAIAPLRAQLQADVESAWQGVRDAAVAGDWPRCAQRLHESKYVRKALADLDQRGAP